MELLYHSSGKFMWHWMSYMSFLSVLLWVTLRKLRLDQNTVLTETDRCIETYLSLILYGWIETTLHASMCVCWYFFIIDEAAYHMKKWGASVAVHITSTGKNHKKNSIPWTNKCIQTTNSNIPKHLHWKIHPPTQLSFTLYNIQLWLLTAPGAPTNYKYNNIRTVQPIKSLFRNPRPDA